MFAIFSTFGVTGFQCREQNWSFRKFFSSTVFLNETLIPARSFFWTKVWIPMGVITDHIFDLRIRIPMEAAKLATILSSNLPQIQLENGTRRAQIPRKPLIFPSPNKQTDKQKILAPPRFELSTLPVLAQCSYRLSYGAVLMWLLLSDYYYQINKKFLPHRGSNTRPSRF